MLYCYHLYTDHIALEFVSRGIAFALVHSAFTAFPEAHFVACYSQLWKLQREAWVLCSLVSFVISVCQSLSIVVAILAIQLGNLWRSFRCYRLKLGSFGAGPWAWCERVLLEPWDRCQGQTRGSHAAVWLVLMSPAEKLYTTWVTILKRKRPEQELWE